MFRIIAQQCDAQEKGTSYVWYASYIKAKFVIYCSCDSKYDSGHYTVTSYFSHQPIIFHSAVVIMVCELI